MALSDGYKQMLCLLRAPTPCTIVPMGVAVTTQQVMANWYCSFVTSLVPYKIIIGTVVRYISYQLLLPFQCLIATVTAIPVPHSNRYHHSSAS